MAKKYPTLFIFKVLEKDAWGPNPLWEALNENYFYQFYKTHIVNKKIKNKIISINL